MAKQSETKVKVAIRVQLKFGPLRCDGIGLSDGETMERLWSFLRPFNKMTKEMRPSHRVDILTHALMYYGIKTKEKLGNYYCEINVSLLISFSNIIYIAQLLMTRYQRAYQTMEVAQETLIKLMSEGVVAIS